MKYRDKLPTYKNIIDGWKAYQEIINGGVTASVFTLAVYYCTPPLAVSWILHLTDVAPWLLLRLM